MTSKTNILLGDLLEKWLIVPEKANILISGLSLNSQKVQPGDLFFAFPGTQADGRRFIENAVNHGAAAILAEANLGISETLEFGALDGRKVPILTLPDLASYCSAIAGEFYNNPSHNMQVIGVTGTNGKTSCAYYLAAAFTKLGSKTGFMGTIGCGLYGEDIVSTGLTTSDPITVQHLLAQMYSTGARIVVMEVSSHALVQGRVNGVRFTNAVFTNLSQDHLDYHGDMASYWAAKKILFENFQLPYAVINANDPYGRELLLDLWGSQYVCAYGQAPIPAEIAQIPMVSAHEIKFSRQGVKARIHSPWGLGLLESPQVGRFNLSNLLAVIATMATLNVHMDDILRVLQNLPVVPGRMQSFSRENRPLVIVDYAHTPDALENVLTVLRENCNAKLWCVFGCGGTRDKIKRHIMGEVAERLAHNVIVTDDNPRMEDAHEIVKDIFKGFKKPDVIKVEHDRAAAIAYAINHAKVHDTILIAGKGHETYQQVGKAKRHFSDAEEVQKLL